MTERTFIIAEAGVNHNGDLDKAFALVDTAADCGADAVKFQTFRADRLATARAAMCAYQKVDSDDFSSQQDMLQALELDEQAFRLLARRCADRGIEFMSTGFDTESLEFLIQETGLKRIKIPSGEVVNPLLLLHAARSRLPVVLSTGLATLDEVETALAVLAYGMIAPGGIPSSVAAREAFRSEEGQAALARYVTVLHCVSDYPAAPADSNLRAMLTMRDAFHLPVGLSDHSVGIAVSLAAVALGATMLEKHFTLDKSLPGPDHRASLAPDELRSLVDGVRVVEQAMGDGVKAPRPTETQNRTAIRGSLVAAVPIEAGTPFSSENVTVKRPGDGLDPMTLLDLNGRPADKDYDSDDQISR